MAYLKTTRTLVNKTITNGSLTIDFTNYNTGVTFQINAPNHGLVGISTVVINSASNANAEYQVIFDRNIVGKTFTCIASDANTLLLNQRFDTFFNPVSYPLFTLQTSALNFSVVNNDFIYAIKNTALRLEVNFNGVVGTELNIVNQDGVPATIASWTNQTNTNITQSGEYAMDFCEGAVYKFKSIDSTKPIILNIIDLVV
jgi:hypothetical protein